MSGTINNTFWNQRTFTLEQVKAVAGYGYEIGVRHGLQGVMS